MNVWQAPTTRCADPGRRAALPETAVSGTQPIANSAAAHRRRSRQGIFRTRIAFTLTELLVVIAIIGILASSVLFTMWGAMEMAREARTRTQIAKLNELLMSRWNSYRTRAISVDRDLESLSENVRQAIRNDPRAMQEIRLNLLRDLMRFEMPDRREDVWPRDDIKNNGPVTFTITYRAGGTSQSATLTGGLHRWPTLGREYYRRVTQNGSRDFNEWTEQYEDSECLYMIIASIRDLGTNGLDFLREDEIGDLDGDGMPEILDAWGRPIAFLRWPAGFVAHPGSDFTWDTSDDIPAYSELQSVIVDSDDTDYVAPEVYDPFDPLRVDRRAAVDMPAAEGEGDGRYYFNYALYPLVFSAGRDGIYGIVRHNQVAESATAPFRYYRTSQNPHAPTGKGRNDPYSVLPWNPGTGRRLGEPFETDGQQGYADNIHNHALGGQ
jgi:prepilin-type N-terminal cleavage/methylation domain-containing protein